MTPRPEIPPPEGAAGRFPWFLAAWLALTAAWMNWAPLRLRDSLPRLQTGFRWDAETFGHFLLLMPFAALAAGSVGSGRRTPAAVSVALVGLALEAGQGFVDGRSLSLFDLLVGYAGAGVAWFATERILRRGTGARAVQAAMAAAIVPLVWAVMLYGTVIGNRGLTLAGWTAAFPIVTGQEAGGSRAYDGSVTAARICAGERFEVCVEPAAEAARRRRLVETAMASGSVRLEAEVVSRSAEHEGPARILTFSDGPYLRNVTLAQRQRNLIFRVRTWRSGPNGTAMEFVLDDAMVENEPTRIVATFARGTVRIEATSDGRKTAGTFRPPFANGLRFQSQERIRIPLMLTGRAALLGTVVQYLGLGLALGYFVRRPSRRILLAALGAALVVCVIDRALGQTVAPTATDVLLVAVAAAVGACSRHGHVAVPGRRAWYARAADRSFP